MRSPSSTLLTPIRCCCSHTLLISIFKDYGFVLLGGKNNNKSDLLMGIVFGPPCIVLWVQFPVCGGCHVCYRVLSIRAVLLWLHNGLQHLNAQQYSCLLVLVSFCYLLQFCMKFNLTGRSVAGPCFVTNLNEPPSSFCSLPSTVG